jgi:hypothetical protein
MHFFSNFQICRFIEGNRSMFGRETDDSAFWVVSEDRRGLVLAHGLLTDVQNGPMGIRAADDRGEN